MKTVAVSLKTAALMLGVSAGYLSAELAAGRLHGWKQPARPRIQPSGIIWRARPRWMITTTELERWMEDKRASYERATDAERARRRIAFTEHRREPWRLYIRAYRERNGRPSRAKDARPGDIAPRRGPNRVRRPKTSAEPARPRGNDEQR